MLILGLFLALFLAFLPIGALKYYEESKVKFYICILTYFITLLLSVALLIFGHNQRKTEEQKTYSKGPVAVSTNSIGCIKYQYYKDVFYKCPDKAINMIEVEERQGKSIIKKVYPVVNN